MAIGNFELLQSILGKSKNEKCGIDIKLLAGNGFHVEFWHVCKELSLKSA